MRLVILVLMVQEVILVKEVILVTGVHKALLEKTGKQVHAENEGTRKPWCSRRRWEARSSWRNWEHWFTG